MQSKSTLKTNVMIIVGLLICLSWTVANATAIVLSTEGNATLGGLTPIGDDDLIEYNPVTNTASLFFDGGALFSNGFEDIDVVHVLNNGNILLSTLGGATIGSLYRRW